MGGADITDAYVLKLLDYSQDPGRVFIQQVKTAEYILNAAWRYGGGLMDDIYDTLMSATGNDN